MNITPPFFKAAPDLRAYTTGFSSATLTLSKPALRGAEPVEEIFAAARDLACTGFVEYSNDGGHM